jgi:hypothetical protein
MDTKQLRQLIKEYGVVVLVEEGHTPLVVKEWQPPQEAPQEVPISARWPKAKPPASPERQRGEPVPISQDAVLERLNKEILALKEQIAQEETAAGETH